MKESLPWLQLKRKYFPGPHEVTRQVTKKFWPKDAPQGMEPILTGTDGNCYPHSVFHGAFGTEDRHEEI